jgi:hypothetical protein
MGLGGHDHLVARAGPEIEIGEMQPGRARAHAGRMAGAEIGREIGLELFRARTMDKLRPGQHIGDGLALRLADHRLAEGNVSGRGHLDP